VLDDKNKMTIVGDTIRGNRRRGAADGWQAETEPRSGYRGALATGAIPEQGR
jgi:hypothetical protein